MFAWLRPGDLVWNYWVNNYLLGKQAAGLRHPVLERRHHPDDRRTARRLRRPGHGQLARPTPGALTVLGVPIDLSRGRPSTPTSSPASPTTSRPWENCYRSTQLLGGTTRFVLSTSGHIAALVNPPGNPKASYQVNKRQPGRPDGLARRGARPQQGTWWTDVAAWLAERCGADEAGPGAARRRAA